VRFRAHISSLQVLYAAIDHTTICENAEIEGEWNDFAVLAIADLHSRN